MTRNHALQYAKVAGAIKFSILNPETCGNPHPSKFACDVRDGGFLVARGMFERADDALAFGLNHSGEMSAPVAALYVQIETEKQAEAGENCCA